MAKAILEVTPALSRGAEVNSYTPEGHKRKQAFHRDAKRFLRSLSVALELTPGEFEIRSNVAGIAVSGEVTLHADHLYVQLSEMSIHRGLSILYRSCKGRRDYSGGQNHYAKVSDLVDPAHEAQFLDACRRLIERATQS